MSEIIAKMLSIGLLITGLSHFLHPALTARLFYDLKQKETAPLTIGFLTLPLGLLIVFGHNIWSFDIPVLITLFGWIMTIKSTVYLLYPKAFRKVSPATKDGFERSYRVAGSLMALTGGVLTYTIFFH